MNALRNAIATDDNAAARRQLERFERLMTEAAKLVDPRTAKEAEAPRPERR